MVEIVMYEESFRKVVDELIAEAEEPVEIYCKVFFAF